MTVFAGDKRSSPDDEAAGAWKKMGHPGEPHPLPRPQGQLVGTRGPDRPVRTGHRDVHRHAPASLRSGLQARLRHCGKYVEVWNDVFMQYNKGADGSYPPLAQKTVDTGHGSGPHARHVPGKEERLRDRAVLAGDRESAEDLGKEVRRGPRHGRFLPDHRRPPALLGVHHRGRPRREAVQPRPGLHPSPADPPRHPLRTQARHVGQLPGPPVIARGGHLRGFLSRAAPARRDDCRRAVAGGRSGSPRRSSRASTSSRSCCPTSRRTRRRSSRDAWHFDSTTPTAFPSRSRRSSPPSTG